MNAPLLLIPLALEWVILVTTLAPIILVGKFEKTPSLGIAIWFVTFLSAGVAVLTSLGVLVWEYFETVSVLSGEEFGGEAWAVALVISFAPWLTLALAGISLAIINQKLEPLVTTAKSVGPLLDLSKTPFQKFEGIKVFTIDLPFAYALATKKEILISSFALATLDKRQLKAVLWHELGHVKKSHYAIKQLARTIRELTPRLAASRALVAEVERLVELAADHYALRKVDLKTLSAARQIFS